MTEGRFLGGIIAGLCGGDDFEDVPANFYDADTKAGRMRAACRTVLERHAEQGELPTSSRFVYYELKQAGVSTEDMGTPTSPDRTVIEAVTELRKKGVIPYDWISDESRRIRSWRYHSTLEHAVLSGLEAARLDVWDGKPPPLILCESRGLAGALVATAAEYLCPIAGTGGQSHGFLVTQVRPLLEDDQMVAYFGDHNPAGEDIEANSREVLETGHIILLDWERVAITPTMAATENLPPKPGTDRRFKGGNPHMSYECEALGQRRNVELLREWLDERLSVPLEDVQARVDEEKKRLSGILRRAMEEKKDD